MLNIMNPPADWSTMKKLIWLRGTPITGGEELTVTGTPPLSLPNSLGKPLKAWSVDLSPYQEGSGDPAPDNVRPIHGTDKVTITTAGQNLLKLDENEMEIRGWNRHFPFSIVAGTFTFTCQNQLIASGPAGVRISLIDSEYNVIKNWSNQYSFGSNVFSATDTVTEEEARNVDNIAFEFRATGATWESIASAQIALNVGSTALPYTPYLAPSQTVIDVPPLGKNLFNVDGYTPYDNAYCNSSSVLTSAGGNQGFVIPIEGNTTYTLSVAVKNSTDIQIGTFSTYPTIGDTATVRASSTGSESSKVVTITSSTDDVYMFVKYNVTGITQNYTKEQILSGLQIEKGSSATSYEPYNATVYTGTIGSEGGESRSGMLVIDGVNTIGRINGAYYITDTVTRAYVVVLNTNLPTTAYPQNIMKCNCAVYNVAIVDNAQTYYIINSGTHIEINVRLLNSLTGITTSDSVADAQAKWNAYAAQHPIQVYYETATPTDFAITAPTIPTPSGTATTWATAEDGIVDGMEVTYVGKASS